MATRFDKFTVKAQEALQAMQDIADRNGNQQMEPIHLLLALVEQPEGVVPVVMQITTGCDLPCCVLFQPRPSLRQSGKTQIRQVFAK